MFHHFGCVSWISSRSTGLKLAIWINNKLRPVYRAHVKRSRRLILVRRGRAPVGQHQESRPLARSNDIPVLNGFVNTIPEPIRFVRLDSAHALSQVWVKSRTITLLRMRTILIFGPISFPEPSLPLSSGMIKRELWEQPFWKSRILPVQSRSQSLRSVTLRIKFQILLITFKALNKQAPN